MKNGTGGFSHNRLEILDKVRLVAIATFKNEIQKVFFLLLQNTYEQVVDAGNAGQGFGIYPDKLIKMPAQLSFGPFTLRKDLPQGAKRALINNVVVHHIYRQFFKGFLLNMRDIGFKNPDHFLVFHLTGQVFRQNLCSGKWYRDEQLTLMIPQVEATQA